MATGNTQQIINYGATANDGTGDPLRTAFIKTDENFDNVWLAGPAGSNVRITNNTISALDTNGNLILKPNGTGVVQSNASIIPNSTNTRDLGTANLRWRSAAIGIGGLTVDGNVTVTGNLSAGNISYTGNVFVGDLRGSVYADDSTIMVDAIDNAMFADSATFGQANVLGNISANYFVGNGSQLTGIASTYGNANVASYLATYTGNISAGNINIGTGTLSYNSGLNAISITDGLEIVGTGSNYWRFNDSTDTLAFPSGASWSSDPATGDDYINSAQDGYLTFTTYDASLSEAVLLKLYHGFAQISVENGVDYDWTFDDTGKLTVAGDIVPSANNVGNLGASDRQWNSLWVANNTIYIGGVPLGVTGNVLTVNGEPVLSNDSDSTITTTGNITANYFIGDGSLLTGVASTGNITFTDTTMSSPDGVDITISAANSEVIIEAFDIRLDATDDLLLTGNDVVSLRNRSTTDPVTIITDYDDSETTWTFSVDGTLTTPGDIVVAGDVTGTASANTLVLKAQPASNTLIQLNSIVDSVISTVANLEIRTDVSGTAKTWEFDTTGDFTAPGNITANYFLGNGSQLTGVNAVTVDVTDTNGLTTIYYPTFVENRTTGQIARADVDLTYRTDDNILTVGNVSVTGNITGNTAGFAIGYRDIPQVSFTGNVTIAATDAGKHFYSTESTDYILTIANNASQGFQTGAAITVVNQGTGNITVAQGSGVTLYLAGNATSGNRTVSTFGMATIMKVATDTWFINGTGVS